MLRSLDCDLGAIVGENRPEVPDKECEDNVPVKIDHVAKEKKKKTSVK
tara:strand:+ start:316 stop:459 length:144 start_codon:yes stop_codon:yes gene_type:complete